jgi:hypothetical protein
MMLKALQTKAKAGKAGEVALDMYRQLLSGNCIDNS